MRWPTLTLCRATVREAEPAEPGVIIVRLLWVGYVGSISVGGKAMDFAQEHRRG